MDYVLGFDGGGTKTDVIAIDLQGKELFAASGQASNPKSEVFEVALDHLIQLLERFYEDRRFAPDRCRGVCLGIAGMYEAEEKQKAAERINEFFREWAHCPPVQFTNDAEIALMAALGQTYGIVVIAGTGSIVYGVTPDGQSFRVGGWGHLLGDKGSGYDIGLHALQAVMESYDGVSPPTRMKELVLTKHRWHSPEALRSYVYQAHITKQHIAEFAKICIEAAAEGDNAARRILTRSAEDLAKQTATLRSRHPWFAASSVAASGSVFHYSALFFSTFKDRLNSGGERIAIFRSDRKPVYGAAMLALRELELRR